MRKLILIVLLLLTLPVQAALAHSEDPAEHYAHQQSLKAGPYTLTLQVEEWPIQAQRFTDMVVRLEGDVRFEDYKIWIQAIPTDGEPAPRSFLSHHDQYPGQSVWGGRRWPIPKAGEWTWEFTVEGPQGVGVIRTEPFTAAPPPGIPPWVGWAMAYTPIAGLLWFELIRRPRLAKRPVPTSTAA